MNEAAAPGRRNPRRVVLIACGKTKNPSPVTTDQMYVGLLFRKSLAYARALNPDLICVLSAKYGLLQLDEVIEPYEMTLNSMRRADLIAWRDRVLAQLRVCTDLKNDHFIFLAGERYREELTTNVTSSEAPLAGLTFGRQLQFLSRRRG